MSRDELTKGRPRCGSFCNGELYEIKLRIIQNDGRVSVSVLRLTKAIGECFDVPQQPPRCKLRNLFSASAILPFIRHTVVGNIIIVI